MLQEKQITLQAENDAPFDNAVLCRVLDLLLYVASKDAPARANEHVRHWRTESFHNKLFIKDNG
jgi:hypothetical protein